jgi:hypothetical protein
MHGGVSQDVADQQYPLTSKPSDDEAMVKPITIHITSNSNIQIPNYKQIPIINVRITETPSPRKEREGKGEIWVIGDWSLFGVWCLGFGY